MCVNQNQIQITQTTETSYEEIVPRVETTDHQCILATNRKRFLAEILEGYQNRKWLDPLKSDITGQPPMDRPYFHENKQYKKCELRTREKVAPLFSGPSLLEKLAGKTRKEVEVEYLPPQNALSYKTESLKVRVKVSRKRPAKNRFRYIADVTDT